MKSSKTSVPSTRVRGMDTVTPGNFAGSKYLARMRSMKARPRALPPMEPLPMMLNWEYSS